MHWRIWWDELWGSLANRITLFRLLLIPCALFLKLWFGWIIAAYFVFTLAAVLDAVDGYIARAYNCVTNFGKIFDPLVDKILIVSFLTLGVQFPRELYPWRTVLFLCEAILVILGIIALWSGKSGKARLGANYFGKTKFFLEASLAQTLFLEEAGWHGILSQFWDFLGFEIDTALLLRSAVLAAILSIIGHLLPKNFVIKRGRV